MQPSLQPTREVVQPEAASDQTKEAMPWVAGHCWVLRGTVLDAQTKQPVANVFVAAITLSDPHGEHVDEHLAVTDAQGRYEIRGLPSGERRIELESEGVAAISQDCPVGGPVRVVVHRVEFLKPGSTAATAAPPSARQSPSLHAR